MLPQVPHHIPLLESLPNVCSLSFLPLIWGMQSWRSSRSHAQVGVCPVLHDTWSTATKARLIPPALSCCSPKWTSGHTLIHSCRLGSSELGTWMGYPGKAVVNVLPKHSSRMVKAWHAFAHQRNQQIPPRYISNIMQDHTIMYSNIFYLIRNLNIIASNMFLRLTYNR